MELIKLGHKKLKNSAAKLTHSQFKQLSMKLLLTETFQPTYASYKIPILCSMNADNNDFLKNSLSKYCFTAKLGRSSEYFQ